MEQTFIEKCNHERAGRCYKRLLARCMELFIYYYEDHTYQMILRKMYL